MQKLITDSSTKLLVLRLSHTIIEMLKGDICSQINPVKTPNESCFFSSVLKKTTKTSVFSELKFNFYYPYYCCILTLTLIDHLFCTFCSFQLYRKEEKIPATRQ